MAWTALGLVILTVPFQLFYPANKTLPFLSIGGLDVGSLDRDELVAKLDEYATSGQVNIAAPGKQWQAAWQDVGIAIDREATADVALSYSAWERFIPLSSFIKTSQIANLPMVAVVDDERLTDFANKIVAEEKQSASNAVIKVEGGEVRVDESKNGYVFLADDVKSQIRRLAVAEDSLLRLRPRLVTPVLSTDDLSQLRSQAESALSKAINIEFKGQAYVPDRSEIGNWLEFPEDTETKKLKLSLNGDKVKNYLSSIDKQSGIEPGVTTVTLLDGQEVARTPANPGQTVATDDSVERIENALLTKASQSVELIAQATPAQEQFVNTYSTSSDGLLAIIKEWDAEAYGDYGVIVRELGGEKRYAELRPDKKYVTASTFKMFVAYALLKKINEGTISYNQTTDIGWTVDACLTEMIVNSTNPCAVSFLNLMGWPETQRIVEEAGFNDTLVDSGCCQEKHSTVRDETNFMLRLNAGTLLDPAGSERLLSMLKRQVWRGGIPSGVPHGTVVADKVGFYAGYMHDVGIIYAPNGTYILGIMSYGGNNPNMAELSRRVYDFFQNQ